jgi:PKD repeat protein
MARLKFGISLAVAAAFALTACTVHKQETPALTGPSELGTSVVVQVSPDVLNQDGSSQSVVTVTVRDTAGQPLRNVPLRADITVNDVITDFGSLSARNVVTDASGRATLVYTAPAAPAINVDSGTVVSINITPSGTNFDNSVARHAAAIRLVPPGVVGAPPSPLVVSFVPPPATVGNPAVFNAVVLDAAGNDATPQVASFIWDFGDGRSASGRTVSHTFTDPGSFAVTLTITDAQNRTARTTNTLSIGQGQLPTATFVTSPASPIVNQTVNFSASGSTAEPGHRITDYAWDFGDGTFGSGALTSHAYSQVGSFTVTLKVTDDAGRKSVLFVQSINVGNGNPTADFTFNPAAPKGGQQVAFDGSPSQAQGGRTIVSYSWSFGDGGSGVGQNVTHTFAPVTVATTYNVLLTVTDSSGKTGSKTLPITINP